MFNNLQEVHMQVPIRHDSKAADADADAAAA